MPRIRKGDLCKLGAEFCICYQLAEPLCTVMPIVQTNPDRHRTDVAIHSAELFCLKKPDGELVIKLINAKQTKLESLNRIGKVSRASLNRIEMALQRERHMQILEADNHNAKRNFRHQSVRNFVS